jgi:hypothetical protein
MKMPEGFSNQVISADNKPKGIPPTVSSDGGVDEGVSEDQVEETTDVDESTEQQPERMTEGSPQTKTSIKEKAPKLIPETDLNNLRSSYDKKMVEMNRQLQEYQASLTTLLEEKQARDKANFEQQISVLPADQQNLQRALFEAAQREQTYTQAIKQREEERNQLVQQFEPLARDVVIRAMAEKYQIDRTEIEDIPDPVTMEAVAKTIAKYNQKLKGNERKVKRADSFEGGSLGTSSPDLKKKYGGSGDIAGYLAERRKLGYK